MSNTQKIKHSKFVTSIQALLSIINKVKKYHGLKSEYGGATPLINGSLHPEVDFVFRGMSNKDYNLSPKILRKGYALSEYDEPLNKFKQEAASYLRTVCGNNNLLWMQYAQHYGVPTRLLDFSSNPLVALYFACKDNINSDGIIWIINSFRFNNCTLKNFNGHDEKWIIDFYISQQKDDELKPGNEMFRPLLFVPDYIDERMNAQSSRMMLWPISSFILDNEIEQKKSYMHLTNEEFSNEKYAFKVVIPAKSKKGIMKQLDLLGINEKSIFPGLDSIGSYIDSYFRSIK
ncbi:FRG domain-containing protein [Gallibacter intestinalis]|uniref:FRG domain-containing protein n=1 Tax=Gallibacter intestinalis TaxID=2779356 RepID=A0ABR9QW08_9FIRM|nr:FRG domain-containing protein [Gallibacter intestinalis]MBE5034720.1 FRG domain-containing protein [Gallibacter intestinalis]